MMNSRIIVVFALLVLNIWCAPLHASDVWVLRNHDSVQIAGSCSALETRDELLLQNTKAADASVVVRGISNGTEVDAGAVVTVPGGRTMTIDYARPMWFTHDPAAKWWAVHLDVPEAVVIASALDLGTTNCSVPQPPTFAPNRGQVALPVFRALVAANVAQRHLIADAGTRDATVAAIVFNAGSSSGSAHVQLFRACDDTIIDERTTLLAANSANTISLPLKVGCDTPARTVLANGFSYYAIVTVDQPSLSLVISTANVASPMSDVVLASMTAVAQPAPAPRLRGVRGH